MNVQERNKRDHYISVAISCVLNGGLILAMIHLITAGPQRDPDLNTTLILDPVEEQVIEEFEEEEIIREEIEMEEVPDLDFNTDFNVDVETDFTPDQEAFDAPQDTTNVNQLTELLTDIASPVQMAGLMQGRTQLARSAMVSRYGGSRGGQGQVAVNRALQWLKNHQLDNGGWTQSGGPGRACPGMTGLALLAFLSHGETPSSAEYGRTVSSAIRWIVENQNQNGVISRSSHTVYGHAMAAYALAEAYSVTQNVMIREPLIRAVDVIVNGMQRNGGFQYGYDANSNRNDSSVGGWQVQALKAATIALPEEERYQRALQLAMDGMLANSRSQQSGYRTIGYTSPGSNLNITAAGALGMIFSGRTRDRQTTELMASLEPVEPNWAEGRRHAVYLWYYVAQAKFQYDPDSRVFRDFNEAMTREFIANQNADGSWDEPTGGGTNGRTGSTAMGALNLMVYYRHLPTGMLENLQQQAPPPQAPVDDDIIRITL